MKLVVSNPGVHPELAAIGAKLASTPEVELNYFTSGSLPYDSKALALVRRLLAENSSARQTIFRRQLPKGLDHLSVRQLSSSYELLYLALRPHRAAFATKVMQRRTNNFDRRLAGRVSNNPPDALLAQAAGAVCTLRAARNSGATTILNAPIAHPITISKILRQEAAANPRWAGTYSYPDVNEASEEVRLADYIFGAGEFTRNSYVEEVGFDPTRFHSIPLGVDTELFTPGSRVTDGVFRIIFVGQLTQRKGLKYVIDAVAKLEVPRKELLLVGHPVGDVMKILPDYPWLRVSASVPRPQLAALYRQADVFVLPSLVEGFAQTPLEAMASGLPVIITPNMGVADIVTPGIDAQVVKVQDSDAIRAVLFDWANDEAIRLAIGAKARHTAAAYTWAAFASRYLSELLSCVNAANPSSAVRRRWPRIP